jgi:hypothetical protein
MDFLRTLQHVTARVDAASPAGVGPKRKLVGAKKLLKERVE